MRSSPLPRERVSLRIGRSQLGQLGGSGNGGNTPFSGVVALLQDPMGVQYAVPVELLPPEYHAQLAQAGLPLALLGCTGPARLDSRRMD